MPPVRLLAVCLATPSAVPPAGLPALARLPELPRPAARKTRVSSRPQAAGPVPGPRRFQMRRR
eukprot:11538025-Alexandrium_andersonii.AAC.1